MTAGRASNLWCARHKSERRQESKKRVVWPETGESSFNWLQLPERLFFGLEIGLDVHMSGVQAFVAKPKSNHCDFDSGLKEVHGRGVANDVGRNPLGFERGTGWQGSSYSLLKDVGGPVGGQRSTPRAGEQDAIATIATLGNLGPPRAGSIRPQWDDAFLACLAH